jgi:hypothetical protein
MGESLLEQILQRNLGKLCPQMVIAVVSSGHE